jgi:hypothetical protein
MSSVEIAKLLTLIVLVVGDVFIVGMLVYEFIQPMMERKNK